MSKNRLALIIDAIDEINQQDPNVISIDGQSVPKELIYGQRMSQCLESHWPDADELTQIAVRAQHIKRWSIPRSDFETGKVGYLTWRKTLGALHADLTRSLMLEHGYDGSQADDTASIIRKEKLRSNPASQTLEDVACLVFLQHYFAPFAAKHDKDKIISIVQKTWKKMSEPAHNIALGLTLPDDLAELVKKALNG